MALVVVEIIGVSGVGKSTLAAELARRFAEAGGSLSARERISATASNMAEAWRMSAALARHRGITREVADKLQKGLRATLRRCGTLVRQKGQLHIKEPGWLSQLVALATHESKVPSEALVEAVIQRAAPAQLWIFLDLPEEKSLERIESRSRGIPKSFRTLPRPGLLEALSTGRRTARLIHEIAARKGLPVLQVETLDLSPADIATLIVARIRDNVTAG